MNAAEQIVAYWHFCVAQGMQPSIRSCMSHLRINGVKIDNNLAPVFLAECIAERPHSKGARQKPFLAIQSTEASQPEHSQSTPAAQSEHGQSAARAQPEHLRTGVMCTRSAPGIRSNISKLESLDLLANSLMPHRLDSDESTLCGPTLFQLEKTPSEAVRKTAPKASKIKPVAEWITPLKQAAWATSSLTLAELNAQERFTVARFHAYKHLNCSSDESKNRARAGKLAAALSALGQSREFGQFTVKEYFEGLAVVEEMTGKLVQSPWDFRASIEFASVTG